MPAASAQDDGYPACSENEILVLLSTLLDYVPLQRPSVDSIGDLMAYAKLHLDQRESSFSLLPLCRAAIVTPRHVFALFGDFVAGSALDRAGLPRSANPYFARGLASEAGIDRAPGRLDGSGRRGRRARRTGSHPFMRAGGKTTSSTRLRRNSLILTSARPRRKTRSNPKLIASCSGATRHWRCCRNAPRRLNWVSS